MFKKLSIQTNVLVVIVFFLFSSGCGGGSKQDISGLNPTSNAILSPSAIPISQKSGEPSPILVQTPTSITFRGIRNDVTPGKIIVSNVDRGALRKIVSVDIVSGNTVIQTDQAALSDAFDSLDVQIRPEISQSTIGEINSSVPGLTMRWVQSRSARTKSRDLGYNKLELGFKNATLNTNNGITLDGTAVINTNPEFDCRINRAPSDLLPTIAYLHAGVQSDFTGGFTVTSKSGSELALTKTWFDEDIGKPFIYGYLVFIAHLKIESTFKGSSSSSLSHTQTLNVAAKAFENYNRGIGWSTDKLFTSQITATESDVENAFGLELDPLSVTISFNLYDVVGPYVQLSENFKAEGKRTVINSVRGTDATVTSAATVEIGLKASTPKMFSEIFEASWTPIYWNYDFEKKDIFHQFFPDTSSVSVGVK